jgi:two-component system chemotaxis sensor kinase CheA
MAEDYQFDEAELVELRAMFFEQATEVIDSLAELILRVESDPSDAEALRTIRRAVHTLKGDSTAFGFGELTSLAHRYEDALDKVRHGDGVASRALIDLLLGGADALAAIVAHYRDNSPLPETGELVRALASLDSTDEVPKEGLSHQPDTLDTATPETQSFAEADGRLFQESMVEVGSPGDLIPVVTTEAGEDLNSAEESSAEEDRRGGSQRRTELDRRDAGRAPASMTLRVESERIDNAMNLVGELIIQRSMISTIAAELQADRPGDDSTRRLNEAVALSGRTLSELQESVMRMRLVAIDQVFKRFPRVVRDSGIKLGKNLHMVVEGGQTEIDKSIVELISDPLIHLVRNACDHGIEMPEARIAVGKPAEGVIKLKARRAGNQIAVEVEDDGAGLDPVRIVAKAIEKGLVSRSETVDWTEQQKLALIFAAGFSTKEQVSDMSGRGVGMDVVRTSVDSLGGSVTLSSVVGQGSRVTIKLPLTMAIVRAMLFESCQRKFALPLDSIREITRLKVGEARTIDGKEVLRLRDRVLPLIRIDEALDLRTPAERDPAARLFVFVVDLGDGRDVGIAVERLYGEQELVLKTVDDALTKSAIVAGASILGDGSVVLILDANAIVNQVTSRSDATQPALQTA